MTHRIYHIGLSDQATGKSLVGDGGEVMICKAGSTEREALYDPNTKASIANPVSAVGGFFDFAVLESVLAVDLYGISAGGIAFVEKGVGGPDFTEFFVDGNDHSQVALIPFHSADQSANATETSTGLFLPARAILSPFAAVNVTDAAATTVTAGLLTGDPGADPDGFVVALTTAAAGSVAVKSAATATRGALLGGGTLDAAGVMPTSKSRVSFTLASIANPVGGIIHLPYNLAA